MLLADIRKIFGESGSDRLLSREVVARLKALPDRPWSRILPGDKPITVNWLGRHLRSLGISARNVRINGTQSKGYHLTDLDDAFARLTAPKGNSTPPTKSK